MSKRLAGRGWLLLSRRRSLSVPRVEHRHEQPVLLALSIAIILTCPSTSRAAAVFSGLGFLPGDTRSAALGISSDGAFVVGHSGNTAQDLEAFRWARNSIEGLNPTQVTTFSTAEASSADGSIVVGSFVNQSGTMEAFRWSMTSGMVGLGFLSTGSETQFSEARDISADGAAIVGKTSFDGRESAAFVWANGGMQPLFPGEDDLWSSEARSVSGDGSVIVGSLSRGRDDPPEAFVWSEAIGLTVLGPDFRVWAVSSDGSVVVGDTGTTGEAVRWENGTMSMLGTLSGHDTSTARAVSHDGSVIVGSSRAGVNTSEAFIWDPVNGMRSVPSVIAGLGLDTSGWSLPAAIAVSDDGRTISGTGFNPDGEVEAWVVTVPEPSSALLVAVGLLAFSIRRWRSQNGVRF